MLSPINNIARTATKNIDSLNILLFLYNGYFDSSICNAFPQCNFYGPIQNNQPPNNWNFDLYPQPDNLHFISNFDAEKLASKVNLDLIICHDRTVQYDMSQQLATLLHINIIVIEHMASSELININDIIPLLKKTKKSVNIFLNPQVQTDLQLWNGQIIPYIIEPIKSIQKKPHSIIIEQDQEEYIQTLNLSNTTIYDIKTIDIKQYHHLLSVNQFYFHLASNTHVIHIPILQAMSAGCVVCSISSPASKTIIKNGENGILIEDAHELLDKFNNLTQQQINTISTNAVKYISDHHNIQYWQNWQQVLNKTSKQTYIL